MRYPRAAALLAFMFLLTVLALNGCRSAGLGRVERPGAPDSGGTAPPFAGILPSPQTLLAGRDPARSASATEQDYIKHGNEFAATLPHQNALAAPGDAVEFQPSWSEANGMDPSRLAYCIYEFTIPGFDRLAQLRYGWATAPEEAHTVWFGLSDWQSDTWYWMYGRDDGMVFFGTTEPYFSDTDVMYVAVVCANDDIGLMRYLRLGQMPAAPLVLTVEPRYARPPVLVSAYAVGSAMPVGTIDSFEWDWDNDGVFEEDTGPSPYSSGDFDAVGEHPLRLRATSSYGEQATTSATVSVVEPWTHSWGTDTYQDIGGAATDGREFCYSAGSTMRSAGHRDALLLKHDLGGELVWAAACGGAGHDEFEDVEVTVYQEGAFAVGQTDSYGAGGYDVLLQRWDTEGNVVWSHVWGTPGLDRADAVACTETGVYVTGATEAMGNMDVLLLKYSFDGNFVWARTWGGDGYDTGTDIAASYEDSPSQYYLLITGATFSPSPLHQDVLYVEFNENGSTFYEYVWRSDSQNNQYGAAIASTGAVNGRTYIAGYVGDEGQREALLVSGPGLSLARTWSNSAECLAYAVCLGVSNIYVAGRGWDLGVSSGGFVLDFTITGSMQNSAFWADTDPDTGITSLKFFPGEGLLVAGNCRAASLGSWTSPAATVTDPGGTWSSFDGTLNTPVGSHGSPVIAAEKLTGGVIDTGGGDRDALLSIVPFP